MKDQHLYLIALSRIPLVGVKTAKLLISYCGGVEHVFTADRKKLITVPGVGSRIADSILYNKTQLHQAAKDIDYLKKNDIKLLDYLDPSYPKRLRHHDDAPLLLYQRGNLNLDNERVVAIVGTRQPTNYGKQKTKELVESLKDYAPLVISGLAYGVDTLAHQQCLLNDVDTAAVMGTGIDTIYPATNRKLASTMTQRQSGLLTEYNVGTPPDRENFPRRNRIIAGLADAIIVIESAAKGGSLITAEYANAYGKDVFALPGKTTDDMSTGCNRLIKTHKAHLCESADDIAYIMRWEKDGPKEGKQHKLFVDLTLEETQVVEILRQREEAQIDWLHNQSQLPMSTLAGILLSLEFKGVVSSLPGKNYALTK